MLIQACCIHQIVNCTHDIALWCSNCSPHPASPAPWTKWHQTQRVLSRCSSHLIQLLKHLWRQRQRLLCVTQAADACGRLPATPQQQLDSHRGLVPLAQEHLRGMGG